MKRRESLMACAKTRRGGIDDLVCDHGKRERKVEGWRKVVKVRWGALKGYGEALKGDVGYI